MSLLEVLPSLQQNRHMSKHKVSILSRTLFIKNLLIHLLTEGEDLTKEKTDTFGQYKKSGDNFRVGRHLRSK